MHHSLRKTPALEIITFGGLALSWQGTALPGLPTEKSRSLFAFLLLHASSWQPRERVIDLLWPELPATTARRRLSQELWRIRKFCGDAGIPEPFLAEGQRLRIDPDMPIQCDLDMFDDILVQLANPDPGLDLTTVRQLPALYNGPLLADLYDDWVLPARERYRNRFLDGLERLLVLEKQVGAFGAGLDLARRLVAENPLSEAYHREVMRLCLTLGRPEDARQQFAACREVLRAELDAEPDHETVALFNQSQHQSVGLGGVAAATGPPSDLHHTPEADDLGAEWDFIGRESERAALLSAVTTAVQGKGSMVLVEGEAGIGKTRLLDAVADDARWRGLQVGWGAADETRQREPYEPAATALAAVLTPLRVQQVGLLVEPLWLETAAQLIPPLAERFPTATQSRLEPKAGQIRLLEALTRTALGLSESAPLLLILDDLHWADEATLDALVYLSRRVADSRLMVVVAYRGEEARANPGLWEALESIDVSPASRRINITRFSLDKTTDLISSVLGLAQAAPLFASRIHEDTGGNPLFVLEALRTLRQEGLLTRDASGAWQTPWDEETFDYGELHLPERVEEVIERRFEQLAPDEQAVFRAASVIGAEFDLAQLSAVSPLPPRQTLAATGVLVQQRFLAETPTAYRFSHDKVRQAVYRTLDPATREAAHRQIGAFLEQHQVERPGLLAFHFDAGKEPARALPFHIEAARRFSAAHALPDAVSHWNRAIEILEGQEHDDGHLLELLSERERLLDILGRRDEQLADLHRMEKLAGGDVQRRVAVLHRQAWMFALTSRFEEAEKRGREAERLAQVAGDLAAQAAALTARGQALEWRGESLQATEPLRKAVAVAESSADFDVLQKARHALANNLLGRAQYPEAQSILQQVIAEYRTAGDQVGEAQALGTLGIVLMEQGQSAEAAAEYERSLTLCQSLGLRYEEGRSRANLANVHYVCGEIGRAIAQYEAAMGIFREVGSPRGEMLISLNLGSAYSTFIGPDEWVIGLARRAMVYCERAGDLIGLGQAWDLLADVARQQGAFADAEEYVGRAVQAFQNAETAYMRTQLLRNQATLHIAAGQPDAALGAIADAIVRCKEHGLADLIADFYSLRAEALLALDRPGEALEASRMALAEITPGVVRSYHIFYRHFLVLQANGQNQQSLPYLEEAHKRLCAVLDSLPDHLQARSRENVQIHRQILAEWANWQPVRQSVALTKVDGTPVAIEWTVSAPADRLIVRKSERRRQQVRRLLAEASAAGARPTALDLAQALGVSVRTIERDLAAIRSRGDSVGPEEHL